MPPAKGPRIQCRGLTPHEAEKFDEMASDLRRMFSGAGQDIQLCEAKDVDGKRMIRFAKDASSPPVFNFIAEQFLSAPHSLIIDHIKEKLKA